MDKSYQNYIKNSENNRRVKSLKRGNIRMTKVIVALSIVMVAVMYALIAFVTEYRHSAASLENLYQKSFYDVTGNMDDIEVKLSKMLVANSPAQQTLLCNEIWRQSNSAAGNLCQLPIEDNGVIKTTHFVNQLGDYTLSLSKKLSSGQSLGAEEEETIDKLHKKCVQLNDELKDLAAKLGASYRISDHINYDKMAKGRFGSEGFKNVEENSIDCPKLIYDGPFSDNALTRDYKYIKDMKASTEEEAKQFVAQHFPDAHNIKYLSMAGGDLATHELSFQTPKNSYYIQLTVNGCQVILLSSYSDSVVSNISGEEASAKAVEYAESLLDTRLKPVWLNIADGEAYVNLAPEVNGVIYYPDLVKAKISMEDGALIGFDSKTFLLNHVVRELPEVTMSAKDAAKKISKRLEVDLVRLALIPKGSSEILCYELDGQYNGCNYIVYINAANGAEEDILRVIDSNQGSMLK